MLDRRKEMLKEAEATLSRGTLPLALLSAWWRAARPTRTTTNPFPLLHRRSPICRARLLPPETLVDPLRTLRVHSR